MPLPALYELTREYRDAAEHLADLELDEQTVADTLEGLSGDFEAKATNVAMFARNLEATAAQIKDAEAQMATRRKAIEARAEGLRRYLLVNMQQTGIQKIECPHFRIAVRDNPPAVDVFDAAQIPSDFMRQAPPPPPAPDKTAIKEVLKAGGDVPGCRLTVTQRLDVR